MHQMICCRFQLIPLNMPIMSLSQEIFIQDVPGGWGHGSMAFTLQKDRPPAVLPPCPGRGTARDLRPGGRGASRERRLSLPVSQFPARPER